jgi:hypothetical protein
MHVYLNDTTRTQDKVCGFSYVEVNGVQKTNEAILLILDIEAEAAYICF